MRPIRDTIFPGPQAHWEAMRALIRERFFLLEALRPLQEHAGDVFFLPFPHMRVAVVAGAEAARAAMITHHHALSARLETDPVVRLLRSGMLVMDGNAHDRMRRIAEPFFHSAYLRAHAERMMRWIDRQIEMWADGETVEMVVAMRRMALEILLDTLFLLPGAAELLWEPLEAARAYIAPGLWLIHPAISELRRPALLKQLDEIVYDLIRQRAAEPDHGDLLSAWIHRSGMNEDEIRDQMVTILIAGHDTVAIWLAWTIALLAQYPDVQARAREEVVKELGGETPDPESIQRLAFLRAIGMESMRLFPPIPVLNRWVVAPMSLDGLQLPEGTRLLISVYSIHRHPQLWEQPEAFRPERFLRPDEGRASFRYLPFGGGTRLCIGASMARLEGFLALARMLQRVIFEPAAPPPRPRLRATLDPWPGVWVHIRRIQRAI